jgi:hypothetical protein
MTTNEIIKEIAVYDGCVFTTDILGTTVKKEGGISRVALDGTNLIKYPYFLNYLTDLNILHRVAVKVMHELIDSPCHDDISDLTDRCSNIQFALLKEPINGEYITLATATAEAIVYLKKYKV